MNSDFIRQAIDRVGVFVQLVFPRKGQGARIRGFSYTIGNANNDLPELFIDGFAGPAYAGVLTDLSLIMKANNRPFRHGELVSLGGKFRLMVVDAADKVKEDLTVQAGQFLGYEDYRVQQVLLPDQDGKFPHQGASHPFNRQKIHSDQEIPRSADASSPIPGENGIIH